MRLRDRVPFLGILLTLLITACFYAPSLAYGFIWDDPTWFGRVVGKSVWDVVSPMPDYQFYRPGTMLYNRLFLRSDGTFDPRLLHAAQIGYHLVNIALVFALCRRLGTGKWIALAAGVMVACYPFSYQAVAWAAPQQPWVMALQSGAWLAYVAGHKRQRNQAPLALSLVLFLLALTAQESTIVLAPLPLLIEWVLHRRQWSQARRSIPWRALTYPLVAAGFGILWLQVERQSGVTALRFEPRVLAYFAQGLVFALVGRPGGYSPEWSIAPGVLLAATALVVAGLLAAAWRAGRGRWATFGLAWALMGIGPAAAGLEYSYVSVGSRLFYYAAPGTALLWACALLPIPERSPRRRWWRITGCVLLCLIVIQSSLLIGGFDRMYAAGAAHIDQLIDATKSAGQRLIFVNYPDRYTKKREPYPIGYWGMTLAPVSVDLGAFPAIVSGHHPQTDSRSMPWIDADARAAGPYRVDLRGIEAQAGVLYRLAQEKDGVYLSRYTLDGSFDLQWAGAIAHQGASDCHIATLGQALCLAAVEIEQHADRIDVTLTWHGLGAAEPHDTVFVHVGQPGRPPIAQADGDIWFGMLPLTTIQAGDTILDQRIITLPEEASSGPYPISVGVYNRLTGQRLPASAPDGDPLPDDATIIGHLP
jgi:hypothetical protein